jgi:hypothetical protein
VPVSDREEALRNVVKHSGAAEGMGYLVMTIESSFASSTQAQDSVLSLPKEFPILV